MSIFFISWNIKNHSHNANNITTATVLLHNSNLCLVTHIPRPLRLRSVRVTSTVTFIGEVLLELTETWAEHLYFILTTSRFLAGSGKFY